MAHTHDVYDTGKYFEINGISRFIKETSDTKLVLVQGDHNSEVITFQMPRYIDGHDMLLCNKIRIHYINLDTMTNNKNADVYEVTDLTLCEECEDVLTFTWTIEAPATKYSGTLSFLIKFECTEGENVLYQWNTAKYVSVNVLAGIDNSEEFVEKYSNVLEEWYNELTKGADSIEELNQQALAEIELAKEDAKEDIQGKANSTMAVITKHAEDTFSEFTVDVEEKAKRTLESIPEDYTGLQREIDKVIDVMSHEAIYSVEGGSVDLENPIVIDATASIINFLPNTGKTQTINGITFNVLDDKSVQVNGTATSEIEFFVINTVKSLKAGEYYLKGCPSGGSFSTYYLQSDMKINNSWYSQFHNGSILDSTNEHLILSDDLIDSSFMVRIRIMSGVTVDNLVFKPMLTPYYDADYAPYVEDITSKKVTAINNDNGDTVEVSIKSDGVVSAIPLYENMTLNADEGLLLFVSYKKSIELEDFSGEPETHVAQYFKEELELTVSSIIEKSESKSLIINIVTDTLEDLDDSESVRMTNETYANIKAVNERVYCDALVHLGDTLNGSQSLYPTWQSVLKHLNSSRKRIADCNEHSVMLVGNHDGIRSLHPNENKTYNAMYSYTRDYVKRNGTTPYGYMDFEDRKIRCIFLATSMYYEPSDSSATTLGWKQTKWFIEEACNTEDGWKLLIFSHISPYDESYEPTKNYVSSKQMECVIGILNAYNNHTQYSYSYDDDIDVSVDFSNHTNTKVVAWFSGHGHYDRVISDATYVTDYNLCCPVILTACARLEQEDEIPDDNADGLNDADVVTPTRASGTVTQDLWDTMIYQPDENKIHMIRFGAGEDRIIELD